MTEKREYKAGHTPMRGPGGRRHQGGRAKDFKGTWKKLLVYCRSYYVPILIAVLCAAIRMGT